MGQDSSQEKTEDATPKRLRDARNKGQTFKSKDVESLAVFAVMFGTMCLMKSYIGEQFRILMVEAFSMTSHSSDVLGSDMYVVGKLAMMTLLKVCAPILLSGMVAAALAGFLQVGPLFSIEPVMPDMKKLNAIENFKNMFKPKAFFELFKNITKVVVIFLMAYWVVKGMIEPFLMTVQVPVQGSAKIGEMVVVKFIIRFLLLFLFLAFFDYFMQRRDFMKNLKMSKDEVKREYKEDEGDPLIKGQRKQIHMEMAMGGDAKQNVKGADAIITNPTHLAIAVKYDKKEMVAPQIVAKGQRMYAEYIKDLAREYDVPIIRNVPLAWSLIELEVGDEVPEKMFTAVAEVLSFVYRMKEAKDLQVAQKAMKK